MFKVKMVKVIADEERIAVHFSASVKILYQMLLCLWCRFKSAKLNAWSACLL